MPGHRLDVLLRLLVKGLRFTRFLLLSLLLKILNCRPLEALPAKRFCLACARATSSQIMLRGTYISSADSSLGIAGSRVHCTPNR